MVGVERLISFGVGGDRRKCEIFDFGPLNLAGDCGAR
jgi:hypothetical protein